MSTCISRIAFLVCMLTCMLTLGGCTVLAVADAAVSTTVTVGSAVVGTAIDVTRAGVGVVTGGGK